MVQLKKALYGLKNSAKDFNSQMGEMLSSDGFIQSKYDGALWTRTLEDGSKMYALLWVDDILVAGNSSPVRRLDALLRARSRRVVSHECKNDVVQCLGYMITRDRINRSMEVLQPKHAYDIGETVRDARSRLHTI